eukprot:CAMPEP_0172298998 /NCGR_PEP_ID=MMETSP1058-20130122/1389_1 /TAXON_ID=83371 /ORGANISM="Detonula confervacea, Strain CCMP 353" /LENGTH=72 /DNA_ID=CAMNT_0013008295 /DNA_START=781 /DNA_END=999 /DNA_ORIENTATION=-
MTGMFYGATAFNKGISSWDTSSVANMGSMFADASAFNQDLCAWNAFFPHTSAFGTFGGSGCHIKTTPDEDSM